MRPSRLSNVAGAVLAGGISSRMGGDKARLAWRGETFSARAARLLGSLFEEVLLVGGGSPDGLRARAVGDPPGPRCALRGLVGALAAARAERVLVVAVDLPLLSRDLLLALTAWPEHDAVVPRDARGPHPTCALYRRRVVLPVARERLETGSLALRGLLDAMDTGYVEGDDLAALDPEGRVLTNVNTPEDLASLSEGSG